MDDLPRVLIVDDVDLVRRAVSRALRGRCVVDEASDEPTAVALLEQHAYDLVLLDMNLERSSGRDVYERVARTHPEHLGDVVFVSGGFNTTEKAWLERRGLRWLIKPLTTEVVRGVLSDRAVAAR
ncbi:MAG: response regulator [Myxococcales bacterium]|nr:response regulator [Myxococcales bacterium]